MLRAFCRNALLREWQHAKQRSFPKVQLVVMMVIGLTLFYIGAVATLCVALDCTLVRSAAVLRILIPFLANVEAGSDLTPHLSILVATRGLVIQEPGVVV